MLFSKNKKYKNCVLEETAVEPVQLLSCDEAPKYISISYGEYLDLLKDRAQLEMVKSIVRNKSVTKYSAADCIEAIFAE